jgi:hypothetical protein
MFVKLSAQMPHGQPVRYQINQTIETLIGLNPLTTKVCLHIPMYFELHTLVKLFLASLASFGALTKIKYLVYMQIVTIAMK